MYETAIAVPVITGLIQVLKMAFLPSRFAPLVAVILGVSFSAFANTLFNFQTVLFGVIVGLSASGFYDAVKVGADEGRVIVSKILEK